MSKKLRFLCSIIVFAFILMLLLSFLQRVLVRKSLMPPWDMTNKISGFYNEPEDEFEVMFFGSSHAYASFSPLELWEETGVKSYVFATQKQPPWATYIYIKEAMKTQSFSLAVVECNMFLDDEEYYTDGVNHSCSDDIPFTWNKVKLAYELSPDLENRMSLLFNFIKYHGRWNDLDRNDFFFVRSKVRDAYKGFVMLEQKHDETQWQPDIREITETVPLQDKQQYWLDKIIKLCEEKGVELWLVKSPSNLSQDQKKLLNSVEETARQNDIPFFDFNMCYDDIGIDGDCFYDQFHLDALGASKFTRYFANLLTEKLPGLKKESDDFGWAEDLGTYKMELGQYE